MNHDIYFRKTQYILLGLFLISLGVDLTVYLDGGRPLISAATLVLMVIMGIRRPRYDTNKRLDALKAEVAK